MPERKLMGTDRILTPAWVNNRDAPEVGLVEIGIQEIKQHAGIDGVNLQWRRTDKCLNGTKKSGSGSQV
jgi:hypothetical protein